MTTTTDDQTTTFKIEDGLVVITAPVTFAIDPDNHAGVLEGDDDALVESLVHDACEYLRNQLADFFTDDVIAALRKLEKEREAA